MKKYIVLAGEKTWNTINGVWAAVKEDSFKLESVYILGTEKRIDAVKDDIVIILENHEVDVEPIPLKAEDAPGERIEEIIEKDDEITLDISGAEKIFAVEALVHPVSKKFDQVYCLHSSESDMDRPYPVLDRKNTVLKDIVGG